MKKHLIIVIILFYLPQGYASSDLVWNKFEVASQRYAEPDAIAIADNIVLFQRPVGGWGKSLSPAINYTDKELQKILENEKIYAAKHDHDPSETPSLTYSHRSATLDNGATHEHIRFLLRVSQATDNIEYKNAAIKGIRYLLAAQRPKGGWPQNYPNTSSYGQHATYNDGAMVGAMTVLSEVANGNYQFINQQTKEEANTAFLKGLDYIINSQIEVNNTLTGWGEQHNQENYKSEPGRVFELPSISSAVTVDILHLLMSLDTPSLRIKQAITSAIQWLESVKIEGIEILRICITEANAKTFLSKEELKSDIYLERGFDNKLTLNKNSRAIWARHYDLETQQPFFVGNDGVKKSALNRIDYERRTGYRWYGTWPANLLNSDWIIWKKNNL